jgi:hypothetical protein
MLKKIGTGGLSSEAKSPAIGGGPCPKTSPLIPLPNEGEGEGKVIEKATSKWFFIRMNAYAKV